MRRTALGLGVLLWGFAATFAHSEARASLKDLRAYLADKLGPPDRCLELDQPTKVDLAWADLNGDGRPEALVYLSGRGWCGSGGCDLMVLERTRHGFRERGDVSISRLPIGVLPTRSHGWRDISVFVSGGGILPGYSAALPFDGTHYAENPSVPPARPLDPKVKVRNLFADAASVSSFAVFPSPAAPSAPTDLPDGVVTVTGRTVEISVPSAFADCWQWVNLTPPSESEPLRYRTGIARKDAAGRLWNVWVYDALAPGEAKIDFALIPSWKFIYPAEARRAAAAKIWTAHVAVP